MENIPNNDREHLRLLSLFHYILGGITAAFSLVLILHIKTGLWILQAGDSLPLEQGGLPPAEFGWMFVGLGSFFLILGLTMAICLIVSGRSLSKRSNYIFSFVMACIMCLSVPLGTILGVFTIIVLSRPSVKQLYGR